MYTELVRSIVFGVFKTKNVLGGLGRGGGGMEGTNEVVFVIFVVRPDTLYGCSSVILRNIDVLCEGVSMF